MKKCDCLLPDCPYCYPGIRRRPRFDEMRRSRKSVSNRFDDQITEDYLKNRYFEKRTVMGGTNPYTQYSIRVDFDIYCYIDPAGNCLFWGECIVGEDFFIVKCDKVHEFQNIYKVLTGKEFKPKIK